MLRRPLIFNDLIRPACTELAFDYQTVSFYIHRGEAAIRTDLREIYWQYGRKENARNFLVLNDYVHVPDEAIEFAWSKNVGRKCLMDVCEIWIHMDSKLFNNGIKVLQCKFFKLIATLVFELARDYIHEGAFQLIFFNVLNFFSQNCEQLHVQKMH